MVIDDTKDGVYLRNHNDGAGDDETVSFTTGKVTRRKTRYIRRRKLVVV